MLIFEFCFSFFKEPMGMRQPLSQIGNFGYASPVSHAGNLSNPVQVSHNLNQGKFSAVLATSKVYHMHFV